MLTNVGQRMMKSAFFFFLLFGASPVAYGDSQARGLSGATAAGLHHSHSNTGSEPHLWPTPQLMATQILNPPREARDRTHILMDASRIPNPLSHNGNSWVSTLLCCQSLYKWIWSFWKEIWLSEVAINMCMYMFWYVYSTFKNLSQKTSPNFESNNYKDVPHRITCDCKRETPNKSS